jgi:hypothetical protein
MTLKTKTVIFASDFHGLLVDHKALSCLISVLKNNKIDELVLNGDVLDLPYLSRHDKRLYERGLFKGYSEIKEIEFVKESILKPLRKATKADIIYRLGNHDERITNPLRLTKEQLERLAIVHDEYGTTKLDKMLDLKSIGIEYDPKEVRNYYRIFDCVHGLSLSKNAPLKNIYEYMGSGTSGHSHRLNSNYINNKHNAYCWLESGCFRTTENVEYLPTGKIADWVNGFVGVTFDLSGRSPLFFAKTHSIIEGTVEFNGKIYKS